MERRQTKRVTTIACKAAQNARSTCTCGVDGFHAFLVDLQMRDRQKYWSALVPYWRPQRNPNHVGSDAADLLKPHLQGCAPTSPPVTPRHQNFRQGVPLPTRLLPHAHTSTPAGSHAATLGISGFGTGGGAAPPAGTTSATPPYPTVRGPRSPSRLDSCGSADSTALRYAHGSVARHTGLLAACQEGQVDAVEGSDLQGLGAAGGWHQTVWGGLALWSRMLCSSFAALGVGGVRAVRREGGGEGEASRVGVRGGTGGRRFVVGLECRGLLRFREADVVRAARLQRNCSKAVLHNMKAAAPGAGFGCARLLPAPGGSQRPVAPSAWWLPAPGCSSVALSARWLPAPGGSQHPVAFRLLPAPGCSQRPVAPSPQTHMART
eukprot:365198-Chlamydomonas_euryale.AAC.3